jgi:hypothetical protein
MQDLARYLEEVVDPTVKDFEANPASVRHAFFACVAVFHGVDYLAYPRSSKALRQQYRQRSQDFALVDTVAHAFEHVQTRRRDAPNLIASAVVSRPPAIPGLMVPGLSIAGDANGAVTLISHPKINLLEVVRRATAFVREQTNRA